MMFAFVQSAYARHGELPNRIPIPPPFNTDEAKTFPPPFETHWQNKDNPGTCKSCHTRIFYEWNGSMMGNAWRDPGWRGAFLLVARLTATDGNCDTPNPPDGTQRALLNPFANSDCTSTFDTGNAGLVTTSGSGSIMDDFCAPCHMPTNYIDNARDWITDSPSGMQAQQVSPTFDPTAADASGEAFAELASQYRNTNSGKSGIFCEVCHTMTETRYTPYHNYEKSGTEYYPVTSNQSRSKFLKSKTQQDMLAVPDANSRNLGYAVGAAAFRLSPHAIAYDKTERFGPLTWNDFTTTKDPYVSSVFGIDFYYQKGDFTGRHEGYYQVKFDRSEACSHCHDVTNPATIKNQYGKWAGGFPIERTYTEWQNSRYADRPGNTYFDPRFKRDCQTCHMQQDFGQPGTALTLYDANGDPLPPRNHEVCNKGQIHDIFYTHHFVGGNAYITNLIGSTVKDDGMVFDYPELLNTSFSSADKNSKYSNARFNNVSDPNNQRPSQHDRFAWERLLNVLTMTVTPEVTTVSAGTTVPITITATNAGSGHNFPTGFPEGRAAWFAVRAFDLGTNPATELQIQDSYWNRTSLGVGYLTASSMYDPNFQTPHYNRDCNWKIPEASPDPYAINLKAVASLDGNCPTLDLPYATPINLVTNAQGLPIDKNGTVIDRNNPLGLPQYVDLDGDGDLFDDSYLADWRMRPLPHQDATYNLDRYSVVIPTGTKGPVMVTVAAYYQSFESIVAKKFLGNLADTDDDLILEPCVLKGPCDGRKPADPSPSPDSVEGAPPVPMEVRNAVINISGQTDTLRPTVTKVSPANSATNVTPDAVIRVKFSEPVKGVDKTSLYLTQSGRTVPALVEQIDDTTWSIFPYDLDVTKKDIQGGETFLLFDTDYVVNVDASKVKDFNNNFMSTSFTSTFKTASGVSSGGDTTAPTVQSVSPSDGKTGVSTTTNIVVTFSEAVTNVNTSSYLLNEDGGGGDCSTLGASISGVITSDSTATKWTFNPDPTLKSKKVHCVTVTTAVTDLAGNHLAQDFKSKFTTK
jgi:hypothetical protein